MIDMLNEISCVRSSRLDGQGQTDRFIYLKLLKFKSLIDCEHANKTTKFSETYNLDKHV